MGFNKSNTIAKTISISQKIQPIKIPSVRKNDLNIFYSYFVHYPPQIYKYIFKITKCVFKQKNEKILSIRIFKTIY